MKKRTYLHRALAFMVCAVICCSLMPVTALAIKGPNPSSWGAPTISDLRIVEVGEGYARLEFYLEQSQGAIKAWQWYMDNGAADGYIVGMINSIDAEYSINGGEWTKGYDSANNYMFNSEISRKDELFIEGECFTSVKESYEELKSAEVRLRVFYSGFYVDDNNKIVPFMGSDHGMYSNELTVVGTASGEKTQVPETAPSFTDVPSDAWYADYVAMLAESNMLKGKSEGKFAPKDNMTVAEAITLAVRLDGLVKENYDPTASYPASGAWYQPYVEYAKANGLPWQYGDYNSPITRSEFAHIFATYYKNNKGFIRQ